VPSFLETGAPYLSIVALLITGALLRFSGGERSVYLNTLWLFLLGVGGQAAAPLLAALEPGRVTIRSADGSEHLFVTSGGFLEVRDNTVLLLLETAERPGDIDVARAEASRDRAQQRLAHRNPELDVVRAEASLRRALNRLRAARMA